MFAVKRAQAKAQPAAAFTRRPAPAGIGNQAALRRMPLMVGAANDPLEHAADRAAGQVMRMKCDTCEAEHPTLQAKSAGSTPESAAPDSVHETLDNPGEALDPAARAFFEPRFGQQFSAVRIHRDSQAAASARAVNAQAYTVGNEIVFNSGRYAPHTESGRSLLAHELAHVVQQSAAPASVQRDTGTGGAPAAPTPEDGRPLTATERAAAAKVFGPALNLDPIRIKESAIIAAGGYIRTLPDGIYVSPGYKIGLPLLIHELTHSYQYQHGVSRITTAAHAFWNHYGYGKEVGLLQAIKAKDCFTNFNTEQQGDIVQDYYELSLTGANTYPWSVFIDQVRAAACIWPAAPAPAAPKGAP